MKSIFYLSVCFVFALPNILCNYSVEKEERNAKIIILVDDYICTESQWVYLRGYKDWISGNEVAIFDSVFIEKGEHKAELNASICEATSLFLLFSKNGPKNFKFAVEPDSCVIINIEEEDGNKSYYKKVLQGNLNNYLNTFIKERTVYLNRIKNQTDSIEHLQKEWFNRLRTAIVTSNYACVCYELGIFLKVDFPQRKEEVMKLLNNTAVKFPDNISLQEFSGRKKSISGTVASQKAQMRIRELLMQQSNQSFLDLSVGNKIDLSFSNLKGIKVPIAINEESYIFVDFWASWCKPCRNEMPSIKKLAKQYENKLSVYSVSIDSDHQAWQKAIEEDSTQLFQHVIGTYSNGQPTKLLQQLNIKMIPANFLIDNNQCIIAKDLHGERLMQVLDSLIQK